MAASKSPGVELMTQGGRIMMGLFFVDAKNCDDAMLEEWLTVALEHASSMPVKTYPCATGGMITTANQWCFPDGALSLLKKTQRK